MSDLVYMKPKKSEYLTLLVVSLVLSALFSLTFIRFEKYGEDFLGILFAFFIFIFVLLFFRLVIMKYSALKLGYQIFMYQTHFNRFGLAAYEKLSEKSNIVSKRGLPSSLVSIFIYVLTVGFLIVPFMWNYKYKKIPHLFVGSQVKGEVPAKFFFNKEISDTRISRTLQIGFFYYFVVGFVFKLLFEGVLTYYYWFVFILFWIGIITLIPIPSTEGFELFRRWNYGWITTVSILVVGMISLLVFDELWYTILLFIFATAVVLSYNFINYVNKKL